MTFAIAVTMSFVGPVFAACDRPVCIVDPVTLALVHTVTFDDQPSGFGPGRMLKGLLLQPGVAIGERFAGQIVWAHGDFDRISGRPLAPLEIQAGADRQNLTIVRLTSTNVLSGDGPAGFPNHHATGEGAVSILFDHDQVSLRFDLRGGEGGTADVVFLRRDGSQIDRLTIGPLAEISYGFARQDNVADIAGIVLTNDDPDGIAIDTLAFDGSDWTS